MPFFCITFHNRGGVDLCPVCLTSYEKDGVDQMIRRLALARADRVPFKDWTLDTFTDG